jgi:putative transposase
MRHLRRLDRTWIEPPIFFVTICTSNRQKILATANVARILEKEWGTSRDRYGWIVGRYVIMPDHVHFFCAPERNAKNLSWFIGGLKNVD